MWSLTNTGRDVVQAGLHSAASLFFVVCNISLQEGHTKLSVVQHAYQAAPGLTRTLSFTKTDKYFIYMFLR